MKAKKIILTALVAILPTVFVYAQKPSEPIKIGGRTVEKDGSVVCATDISLLTQPVINEINMGMRSIERNGNIQYYVVIAVPYKEINIESDGALALSMKNGETICLPVQRQMKWNQDRLLVGTGEKTAYVMRIPFEITESQKDELISGDVTNVRLTGTDRAIDFKTKRFSNILKRQYGELLAFQGPSAASSTGKSSNSGATASATASTDNGIHETAATKTLTVYDDVELGNYSNGYCVICETHTGKAYIIDINGDVTGILTLEPNWTECSFDKTGHLMVRFPGYFAFVDSKGNITYKIEQAMSVTELVDGVMKISEGLANDKKPTIRYIDFNGKHVYPKYDTPGLAYNTPVFPIVDGRRLDVKRIVEGFDATYYQYGFMDQNGEPVTDHIFYRAHSFSEELAAVAIYNQNQLLWGFIDKSGHYVIEPKFTNEPGDFHDGYAVVKKANGKYCYVDKSGNAVSGEYNKAYPFIGGYARVSKDKQTAYFLDNQDYFLIDRDMKVVKNIDSQLFNGKNIYGLDLIQADGMYTANGEKLFSRYSEDIAFSADGLSAINETPMKASYFAPGKLKGYINTNGEVILKVVRSEF